MKPNTAAYFYIKSLIKQRVSFSVGKTKRSIYVSSGLATKKFFDDSLSKTCFIAYNMIKSDINKSKQKPPQTQDVRYFQHDIDSEMFIPEAWYFDLKSAYATILYNDKLISEKTFNFIMKLQKQERLMCVGMLASRRQWEEYDYKKMEFIEKDLDENPLAPFFFHACKRTFETMDILKSVIGRNNAIFTWVDCVYFREFNNDARAAFALAGEMGFNINFNKIENLRVKIFKKHMRIRYKDGLKNKVFNIPHDSGKYTEIKTKILSSFKKQSQL